MYASLVLTKLLSTGNFLLYVFPRDKMFSHSLSFPVPHQVLYIVVYLFANHLITLRVQSKNHQQNRLSVLKYVLVHLIYISCRIFCRTSTSH